MSDVIVTTLGRAEDRIRELEAQVAALTASLAEAESERDVYQVTLEEYADRENWHMSNRGVTDWIGGGKGPDRAEHALSICAAKRGEP